MNIDMADPTEEQKKNRELNIEITIPIIDILKNLQTDLINSIIAQKEQLLKEAVEHKLGKDFTNEDVINKCNIIFLPNGTEHLIVDGEKMIEFYQPIHEMKYAELKAGINYRKFYSESEES